MRCRLKQERTIILHYHLFKNAGTSVDAILKRNFGDRWVTREFPSDNENNTELVGEWIRETPEAVAYSSHTMMGSIPQVEGVRIISFMLLRDPIERIKSAYRFERKQEADTWETRLAKKTSLEGYVRGRLAQPGDRQCRNFQTHRLASLVPGDAPERESAIRALNRLSVIGLVEAFDAAIAALAEAIRPAYPDFTWNSVHANRSVPRPTSNNDQNVEKLLAQSNQDDAAILAEARKRILKLNSAT